MSRFGLMTGAAMLAALASAATPTLARDRTGAIAAGVVGGLAVGALAASAAQPRTHYPGPNSYQVYEEEPSCRVVTRRGYDDWGRPRVWREEICH
jgi:hypothetical protein